jgi:hypothetical protein
MYSSNTPGKKKKTCIALNNVACRGYVLLVEHLSLAPVQLVQLVIVHFDFHAYMV